jgi:hypothetical protein
VSSRTQREKAVALVRAIDSADTPRALYRKLRALLPDLGAIPGTQVTLLRLCTAEEKYREALADAKFILEIR